MTPVQAPAAQEHTPGPWKVEQGRFAGRYVAGPDDFPICNMIGNGDPRGMERERNGIHAANARLIAASPQLLKAAHMAYLNMLRVHSAERHTLSYQAALCELRDALAAATGRDAQSVQEEYEAAATGSEQ